ncbi:UvrD-like helicase C-terminal domain-containing protein [Pavlovales sp. CCMP2436]|nr:UvrD-like helicase C-terminal domain-containing protein [Pavlovales sp. CCMP2436]
MNSEQENSLENILEPSSNSASAALQAAHASAASRGALQAANLAKAEAEALGVAAMRLRDEATAAADQLNNLGKLTDIARGLKLSADADGVRNFVATVTLDEGESEGKVVEAVRLMTLHKSKGLEFEVVIVTHCEDGSIPLAAFSKADVEEERRLLYVGAFDGDATLCPFLIELSGKLPPELLVFKATRPLKVAARPPGAQRPGAPSSWKRTASTFAPRRGILG